ncbi:MAG: aminoacyl-tRNA hydrolase [Alphaproteobacteria bacterium]|nr:aminoacyl-tRNA hydrolase [Alphaproteobacteria bacterium]
MWLIVGLGNPGKDYERNRHNIGFMTVDRIADLYGFSSFRNKYKGEYAEGNIGTERVILLKPQTYMNESGRSVGELVRFYKIPTSHIVVFHDELDVMGGKLKVKVGGGAAGHNGLKSMDAWLDDANYKRVRMGIGHPGDRDRVTGYVLGNFSKDEETWLDPLLMTVAKNTPLLLGGEDSEFLNNVAQATGSPKPPKEKKDDKNGI